MTRSDVLRWPAVIDISRAICRTPDGVRAARSVCPGGPRRSRISSGWRRRFPLLVDHGALIDSRGVIADMGAGAPFGA